MLTFKRGIFTFFKRLADTVGETRSVEQTGCKMESWSVKSEAQVKIFSIMFRVSMLTFVSNLSKSFDDLSVSFMASFVYSLSVLLVVSFAEPKPVA